MSYFQNHYSLLRYPLGTEEQPGFRAAQLGAIHAVAGHFSQRSDPAIVTMPTGSGKTGVMNACAFVLRATRVLVVTPSRLVREQIAEEMANLTLLRNLNALPEDIPRPNVKSVSERLTTPQLWHGLLQYDVVVGTVQSISPALQDVADPEPDQFDIVMVDEAHHSSAHTWQTLLNCFPGSLRILFTATPFRRDRREIHGRFVYTYDLRRARTDLVFGRIRYHAVQERGDLRTRDVAVANATQRRFLEDQNAGLDHLIMVRTDRKTRAKELQEIYAEYTDLRLAPLNSNHSLRHAKTVIRRLRAGELDGIITVNMLGEGFDFPRLKIAAVHAPHKSLAATLQFIGRFARTAGENLGVATFLAVPDDIEIERTRLFEAGAAWQDIVENLSAEQMERETHLREMLESFDPRGAPAPDLGDLSLYALEPYHHVKIYRTVGTVNLNADFETPEDTVLAYRSVSPTHDAAVWITRQRSAVRWSRDGRIVDVRHQLYAVYFDQATRLLFICASRRTEAVYEDIARQVTEGEPRILSLARINRALNGFRDLKFFNVGMRNRVLGNQTESYRIIAGPSADKAILPSDARLFHRGHLFGRGEKEEGPITIGLSSASKIWSNKTSQLPDLIAWCRELARNLQTDRVPVTGSGLDYLSAGEEVDTLPTGIFIANWEYSVYRNPRMADIHENGAVRTIQLLDLEIKIERERCTEDQVALVFQNGEAAYRAIFSYNADRLFEPSTRHEIDVNVVSGNSSIPLIEFLNENPLCFYTEDLSLLIGFDLHRPPAREQTPFDINQIDVVSWERERVNVQLECGFSQDDRCSIHDFIETQLADSTASVAYYDHGSGEVADFVAFTERTDKVIVELFHCKRAGGEEPGNRVNDVYEVCSQAVKSVVFADPERLFQQIGGRYRRRAGASRFIRGDLDTLSNLVDSNSPTNFQFEMVVVQPGISREHLATRIANLLSATSDHLVRGGFSPLRVLSS